MILYPQKWDKMPEVGDSFNPVCVTYEHGEPEPRFGFEFGWNREHCSPTRHGYHTVLCRQEPGQEDWTVIAVLDEFQTRFLGRQIVDEFM